MIVMHITPVIGPINIRHQAVLMMIWMYELLVETQDWYTQQNWSGQTEWSESMICTRWNRSLEDWWTQIDVWPNDLMLQWVCCDIYGIKYCNCFKFDTQTPRCYALNTADTKFECWWICFDMIWIRMSESDENDKALVRLMYLEVMCHTSPIHPQQLYHFDSFLRRLVFSPTLARHNILPQIFSRIFFCFRKSFKTRERRSMTATQFKYPKFSQF